MKQTAVPLMMTIVKHKSQHHIQKANCKGKNSMLLTQIHQLMIFRMQRQLVTGKVSLKFRLFLLSYLNHPVILFTKIAISKKGELMMK